ncbi:RHS repeat-associated core domain-containing protein [Nonomuraea solani]|uniref:RHS repeat-associated core domain-containing protein n=1 Tax=Nonomuraea solani TaxID=1144553 RepID=A0A1H6EUF7_9ACTN|nr:RHS repeat-associated core domain-containing protein [Nonomuraea solani]SEH00686.1 RHS repeat-associated core domain-containing protein [Nonomuraea solani]
MAAPLGLFKALAAFLRSPGAGARAGATAIRPIRSSRRAGRDRAYASRVLTRDPIDVATGEVLLRQVDAEVAGALPLSFERTYVSSYRNGRLFGAAWASTLDERLAIGDGHVRFAAADGMVLTYPDAGPRLPLEEVDGGYTITDPLTGVIRHFTGTELAAVSDRNGHRIEIARSGGLLEVRLPGGRQVAVELEGERAAVLRVAGEVVASYHHDDAGRLREVGDARGEPLRFAYDEGGRLAGWTDRNGFHYRYTYDELGRGVRGEGSGGFLDVSLAYAADSTTVTDALGHVTTYHFNELRQVVAEVDPLGRRTLSEWDRDDRLLSRTDPLGRTTRYGYDPAGNLTTVVRPDGLRMTARYDALNLPVEIVEADGAVWRQEYDERGNLVAVTDPGGGRTRHAYDALGHLTATTDALGRRTRVETDAAGLLSAVTGPVGAAIRVERDAAGRVTALTDPAEGVTRLGWAPGGELLWRTMPGGGTERWRHDGEGNPVEAVDAAGGTIRTEFGPFDVPVAEVGPDGGRLAYTYDRELRPLTVTDARGLVWRYEYDAAGRLVRETDYDGRAHRYAYDDGDRLVERVNAAGQTVRYAYDVLDNLVEERGEDVTTFAYDPAGRLVHARGPGAELRFERDALGRILAETCDGGTLTSDYDLAGQRVRRRTPSGARSDWSYDAGGRATELRTAGGALRFRYDAAGREVERHAGGWALSQSWTPDHLPASQTAWGVLHRSYQYRADGLLTAVTDQDDGPRHYTLDPADRVTSVCSADREERYVYDPAGTVTEASVHAGPALVLAGRVRYEYDAQGRVTRRTSGSREWRYEWDAEDRLVAAVTPGGGTWRYRYDPLGRRVAKQRLDGATVAEEIRFVWDGDVLAEQVTDGGVTTWDHEPGTFRPLTQTERAHGGGPRFHVVVTDAIGTPTELIDAAGRITARLRTTLWGDGGPSPCPLRFPGQYRDDETGLHYNVHRYYDPVAGRYLSQDPLGLAPGPDPYAYVPNPTRQIDPLGLAPCLPAVHVAFGLGKNGQLKAFAATVGARTYFNLPREWYVGEFKEIVRHIVDHPSAKISFNLTGIHSPRASVKRVRKYGRTMGLRRGTEFMGKKAGYTDFELYTIAHAPQSWSKITWYRESRLPWRKGLRETANPFG